MNIKPFLRQYIAVIGLILTFGALFGTPVEAATKYPAGTLIQALDSGTIYYIATDGRRYGISNMGVYHSWYPNFSNVKSVSTERDLSYIAKSKNPVNVRPGKTLVKFGADPKIYAVDTAATLRLLTTEEIAITLYGNNWQSFIVPLPAKDRTLYTLGQDIRDPNTFSRSQTIAETNTIEDELRARKYIVVKNIVKTRVADASYGQPMLKNLRTDLRHGLRPSFHPGITNYQITGYSNEDRVTFTPYGYTDDVQINVNETTVQSGTPITIELNSGLNDIIITIRTPQGAVQRYMILVDRTPVNANPYLKSLGHSLRGRLSPVFSPNEIKYDLRAEYLESSITLSPVPQENRSTVYVNDIPTRNNRSHLISLVPGENVIIVRSRAEDGTEKIYTLKVYRSPWPRTEDLELLSLRETLADSLSPGFNANMTLYDITANRDEATVTITARPRNPKATVYINGEEGQTRIVPLYWGDTEIRVTVAIGVGATSDYIIRVDRQDR